MKKFSYDDVIDGIKRGDLVRWLATIEAVYEMLDSSPACLAGMWEEFNVLLGEDE